MSKLKEQACCVLILLCQRQSAIFDGSGITHGYDLNAKTDNRLGSKLYCPRQLVIPIEVWPDTGPRCPQANRAKNYGGP